jgi:hypothetical protein
MAELNNGEVVTILVALKHFVRNEFPTIITEDFFPQKIGEAQKNRAVDELVSTFKQEGGMIKHLQTIYTKIYEDFTPYE